MIVLGIDPGLGVCGAALVVLYPGTRPDVRATWSWRTEGALLDRLAQLEKGLRGVLAVGGRAELAELVVAEGWEYQGRARSSHASAAQIARLLERIRGVVLATGRGYAEVLPREAKAAVSAGRAKAQAPLLARVTTGVAARSQHERDAVCAAVAGGRVAMLPPALRGPLKSGNGLPCPHRKPAPGGRSRSTSTRPPSPRSTPR